MNISNLKIENFRNIEAIDLQVPHDNKVICMVGENGSAKTSVLSLIAEAIVSRTKLKFPNFSLSNGKRYRLLTTTEIGPKNDFYKVSLSYKSMTPVEFLYKKFVAKTADVPRELYAEDFPGKVLPSNGIFSLESSTLDSLGADDDFLRKNVFLIRPGGRYERYEYEILDTATQTNVLVRDAYDGEMPYPFVVSHSGDDFQTIMLNMVFDARIGYEQSKNSFDWISVLLQKITGKDFGNIKISPMPFRQIVSMKFGSLKYLSQGELDLLVTIVSVLQQQLYFYFSYSPEEREKYNISSALDVPGIVLIDEVDLHLHPKAQESYLKILTEYFPHIQFVITTHSPFIVRGLPNESIVISLPSGRVFTDPFEKMDIDSITRIIFQHNGGFSETVVKLISEFRGELVSPSPNIDRLKTIYDFLSESEGAKAELELYLASYGSANIYNTLKHNKG